MRCPVCQAENPPTARVCTRCGGGLTASAAGSGIAGTGGFGAEPISRERETSRPLPPPVPPGSLPTRFDSYEILRKEDGSLWELGRGAMGITYKAVDVDLQVPVALKVINPAVLGNHDAADRFLREARSAAKLRHGNIASVFRLGRAGDTHFYAMEFCEGQTVHQLVDRRGPLELRLALEIARQVANALVVAQDHGVVHRDIKPSNLMVTGRVPDEFTVKVIDFGLAKHTAPDSADIDVSVASNRAGFVGTAHFASPEQLEDRPVDFRSDIYSLGVTLWFMLTGRPLFEGSLTRVVTQHLAQKPPIEKLQWLPARIAALLESMLAKEPESRPASTRELRDQLQLAVEEASLDITFAAQPDLLPPPPSTRPPASPGSSRPASPAASAPAAPVSSVASRPTTPPSPAELPTRLPPVLPPPSASAPPPAEPARPQPSSAGPIILVAMLGVFLLIAAVGAGYAFKRWGKRLVAIGNPTTEPANPSKTGPLNAAPTPAPSATLAQPDALRELRMAEQAAETLSRKLYNVNVVNPQLTATVEKRLQGDPDSESYKSAAQSIERYRQMAQGDEEAVIDAERQYLISAKRLAAVDPNVLRAAFDQLEEEVSKAGVGFPQQVVKLMRANLPNLKVDATRLDADFREQLQALQNR